MSEIVDIIRDLIQLENLVHLKYPDKTVLPDELQRLKGRLAELHPEGGPRRAADYDLFLRIGLVLQSHPESPTMGQLSEKLGVPLSTATRIIDWLVHSHYVERLPDSDDRRIVRVTLTENGQNLYENITTFLEQRVERLLQDFTADERADLVRLLHKFVEAVRREVSG